MSQLTSHDGHKGLKLVSDILRLCQYSSAPVCLLPAATVSDMLAHRTNGETVTVPHAFSLEHCTLSFLSRPLNVVGEGPMPHHGRALYRDKTKLDEERGLAGCTSCSSD